MPYKKGFAAGPMPRRRGRGDRILAVVTIFPGSTVESVTESLPGMLECGNLL